ncbi:MAG TPA: hypothetical protein VFU15_10025 [Bacteroidia bacterium]|nr:hypothetical protein [Bacteroidia bacterium]
MKHTYLRFLTALIFMTLAANLPGQGFGLPPGFDLKAFQKNEDQAMWLVQYDSAWIHTASYDHLPQSRDYVCLPDKKGWKVVTGTLDSSGFRDAVYYSVDAKNAVTRAQKQTDTALVNAMARALYNSNAALGKLNIKASGWRKFVKINADMTIAVWALCDADGSGNIWYGPECTWYYSSDGRKLTTSKIVNKAPLMAGKAGQTLNLSCPTDKMPTVGTMFIAHKYRMDYTEITISYRTGSSTFRYDQSNKSYSWEHNAR